ncbi:hypothetical protein O181_096509 [Austropuccinia psidii MF-1]|uniref:Uncharacterized protein n=1 Tax=Austropuccinia psidii MF-1 TaxID=1389203 RepID=A0A9Q3J7F5_9BASI|nr:hypothetical protein [Austropuccinia psidii MF-1]
MIPPHSKDFGFPRDLSLQREKMISWNRGLEKREVAVVQSHNTPPGMACIEQFVLTHQIFQELLQWGMADREFKPDSHYKELVESIQKISLKEIFFKELIIDKKWNKR